MQASDGNLYGTCSEGGANGDGTVFKLSLTSLSIEALDPYDATLMTPASTIMRPSVLRWNSFLPETEATARRQILLKITAPPNTPLRLYVHNPQQQGPGTDDGHNHFAGRVHGWLYAYTKDGTKWMASPGIPVKTQEGTAAYSNYADAGKSAVSQLKTGSNGIAYVYYTAPSISGEETVTVSTVDAVANKRQTADLPLLLKMTDGNADFTSLAESDTIELTGQTGDHPDSHYGTATMNQALQALALNYATEYINSGMNHMPHTLPSPKLPVNDMSLPWGGLFDIDKTWDANGGHVGHRRGIEADIGNVSTGHGLTPKSQWAKTFEKILLEQGWWANAGNLWASEKTHYHILLNGKGTPYIVFPGTDEIKWQNPAQRLLSVPLQLLNRGGINADSLLFTGFTFTNNVTLFTPALPVAAPGLPIQASTTYILTVKVPAAVKTFQISPSGYAMVGGSVPYSKKFPTSMVSVKVPKVP